MSRKARWSARLLPDARSDLVGSLRDEANLQLEMAARADAIGHWTADEFRAGASTHTLLADQLQAADLYWVTAPMTRIAMDASQDVPVLTREVIPAAGLMAFEDPLPGWDTTAIGGLTLRSPDGMIDSFDPLVADALAWYWDPAGELLLWLLCKPHRLRWPLLKAPFRHLVPAVSVRLTPPLDLETARAVGAGGVDDGTTKALISFATACWVLMVTPTAAERRSVDGRSGQPAHAGTPPQARVSVVDLRPLRHIPHDDPETGSGRKLTVRHYVRGHWTHQAHGPNHSLRRLQWIAPYIKGPHDAPLQDTDRVMVWRRL